MNKLDRVLQRILLLCIVFSLLHLDKTYALAPRSNSISNTSFYSQLIPLIKSVVGEGVYFSPPFLTRGVPTRDESGTSHQMKLDVRMLKDGSYEALVPQGVVQNKHYYLDVSFLVPHDLLPAELASDLEGFSTHKVTEILQERFSEAFSTSSLVKVIPKQTPTSKVVKDYPDLRYGFDKQSLIANMTRQGLVVHALFLISSEEGLKTYQSWAGQMGSERKIYQEESIPTLLQSSDWLTREIHSHQSALDLLSENAWKFFHVFQNETSEKAQAVSQFKKILNLLDVSQMVDLSKMQWFEEGQIFIPKGKSDNPFGKEMEEFMSQQNSVAMLATYLYFLTVPHYEIGKPKSVGDQEVIEALIRFYYRTAQFYSKKARNALGDPTLFEPMLDYLGRYVNQLNEAIRDQHHAIDMNQDEDFSEHQLLVLYQLGLNHEEIKKLQSLRKKFEEEKGFAWDILVLHEILSEDSFVKAFPKIRAHKALRLDQRLHETILGTGRIGTSALALRLGKDIQLIASQELDRGGPLVKGRYLLSTQGLEVTEQERNQAISELLQQMTPSESKEMPEETISERAKLNLALAKVRQMMNDETVRALEIPVRFTNGESIRFHDLLAQRRLNFQRGDSSLKAIQDPNTDTETRVNTIYPVKVIFDHTIVGWIYVLDNKEYEEKMKLAFTKKGISQDNYPKPLMVLHFNKEMDQEEKILFQLLYDATPGGVYIRKPADKDPDVWSQLGTAELEPKLLVEGDDSVLSEWKRLLEVRKQMLRRVEGRKGPFYFVKAQVPKGLVAPGGPYLYSGDFFFRAGKASEDFAYISTCSCSTNATAVFSFFMSMLGGGMGREMIDLIGPTYHGYTPGKDMKDGYGSLNPQKSGADVSLRLSQPNTNPKFIAVRTPTAYEDGKIKILGGSMFSLNFTLPYQVPVAVMRAFLERVSEEEQDLVLTIEGKEQTWKDSIFAKQTGVIVYLDFLQQFQKGVYSAVLPYDNEVSFSWMVRRMVDNNYRIYHRQTESLQRRKMLLVLDNDTNNEESLFTQL